jgi:hypothetical protein
MYWFNLDKKVSFIVRESGPDRKSVLSFALEPYVVNSTCLSRNYGRAPPLPTPASRNITLPALTKPGTGKTPSVR